METSRHLVILDLDETLVHATEAPLARAPDFRVGKYAVYRRPFLAEFLATLATWYELAVWSSASRPYVEQVVAQILPGHALRFVWAQERCTRWLDSEEVEHHWGKDLKKVRKLGFDLDRVLMIDDTPGKLRRNYGNHVPVREFRGDLADTELRDLLPFLDTLRALPGLRNVEKRTWRGATSSPAPEVASGFERDGELVVLYRPVGPAELAKIEASCWTRFPPRFAWQPIFYPVLNRRYAEHIAARWNVEESGAGFVTRFRVPAAVAGRYPVQVVGAAWCQELWVPAEELDALNDALVGPIEVVARFPPAT